MGFISKLVSVLAKTSKFFKLINILGESIDHFLVKYKETFGDEETDFGDNGGDSGGTGNNPGEESERDSK